MVEDFLDFQQIIIFQAIMQNIVKNSSHGLLIGRTSIFKTNGVAI